MSPFNRYKYKDRQYRWTDGHERLTDVLCGMKYELGTTQHRILCSPDESREKLLRLRIHSTLKG